MDQPGEFPSYYRIGGDPVRWPELCAALTPEALYAFCRERLPAFMRPRYIQLRGALPKTATARVQKFKLAAEGVAGAWDRQARRKPALRRAAAPWTLKVAFL